jgi:DNA-binding Lrp family transcriptional regulator
MLDARELLIEAYRDPGKTGFPVCALVGLNIEHELHGEVMGEIAKLNEVTWASTTTGRYDGFAFVRSPSTEALYLFLRDVLLKIKGIRDTETYVCLHVEKSGRLS